MVEEYSVTYGGWLYNFTTPWRLGLASFGGEVVGIWVRDAARDRTDTSPPAHTTVSIISQWLVFTPILCPPAAVLLGNHRLEPVYTTSLSKTRATHTHLVYLHVDL
jgi:hypothetical protein